MKRRALKVGLVVFALWPVVQWGLASSYGVSPWKLGGWAMFTAPQFPVGVTPFEVRGDQLVPITDARLTPELRREVRRLAGYRRTIGRFASSDRLAKALYKERPQWGVVMVVIDSRRLNRETALIDREFDKYVYRAGVRVDEKVESAGGGGARSGSAVR